MTRLQTSSNPVEIPRRRLPRNRRQSVTAAMPAPATAQCSGGRLWRISGTGLILPSRETQDPHTNGHPRLPGLGLLETARAASIANKNVGPAHRLQHDDGGRVGVSE